MTKLPKCGSAAREDVLKHNQLMKLMQFLMGLNDIYQPIRSSLLSRDALPDVKDAFAIVSREESYRGIASTSFGSVFKTQVSSFMSKTNFSNSRNNGNKRFDNNKRVYTFGNTANNTVRRPYLFDEPSNQTLGNHSDVTTYVSKTLWHSILGHPADQVFGVLQKELHVSKQLHVSPCDICHRAKQTRDYFLVSNHNTSAINDLIHLDLWGPYKVPSREGFRYFLIVVDDYSRGVWQTSKSPNDEERATTNDEDNASNSPNSSNTIKDESGNSTSTGDKSISKGNSQHTQNVLIFSDQNNVGSDIPSNISTKNNEGIQPAINRRSTRTTKIPTKFNDYVVNSSVKYGLEKVIIMENLPPQNDDQNIPEEEPILGQAPAAPVGFGQLWVGGQIPNNNNGWLEEDPEEGDDEEEEMEVDDEENNSEVRPQIPEGLRFREEPPIPLTSVPRADDPYVMIKDAANTAQEDVDDDADADKDPQPSESRGSLRNL
ncbi:ribonuclease H-like domain-containing protein [Tanacetum coccineum]